MATGLEPVHRQVSGQGTVRGLLADLERGIAGKTGRGSLAKALDAVQDRVFACLREHFGGDAVAKLFTLKILNLWLAKREYQARSTTMFSRPVSLIVDPSNYCNLQCPGCVHSPSVKSSFLWDRGSLLPDRFQKFVERYGPAATHIVFCSYGEPLLNPATPAFVRAAKAYLLDTMLSTNLSIGKLDAEAYVESGLDFMVLSIDGATQSVYEKYRRNGNLDRVYANLRKLVEAKRKLHSPTPILQWQFLAFEHNQHEIPAAIEIARDLGLDQFHICAPDDRSWDDPQIRASGVQSAVLRLNPGSGGGKKPVPAAQAPLDGMVIDREFSTTWEDRFHRYAGDEPETPEAGPGHTCKWLYTNLTMDATGRIIPCCGAPSVTADLNFGMFGLDGNAEMYNSPKHRLSRLYFRDQAAYAIEKSAWKEDKLPYCVNCTWNQDRPNVDAPHFAEYLETNLRGILDAETIRDLSSW